MSQPHGDTQPIHVDAAVITVSDTRTSATDQSGQVIQTLMESEGHRLVDYQILPDEPDQIRVRVLELCQRSPLDLVILNGGTGIAPRDTTYDAIAGLLEKTLPGFGELFRWLSYQEIGSRAIASRAIAGTCQGKLIFSLPGSSNAVRLAMTALLLPEISHLVKQMRGE
jgi:molybdenum cofactor biosynthesis protein B